jgi:flagellar basal-body rod modification protein FlgD
MQDFLHVLMTQLTYQNPLKPVDNDQFMAQLAQFTALGQTQQMNSNIQQLVANQSSLQSVGLIGRTVTVSTASGDAVGKVVGLSLSGSSPQLTITTASGQTYSSIGLDQITAVQ